MHALTRSLFYFKNICASSRVKVKYFLLLSVEVPDSALQIYKNAETFRQYMGNLDLIVNIFNRMHSSLLDIERPLVATKLEAIEKALQKGLKHLNWKSHTISEFISSTMSVVKEASTVLQTIKNNVKETKKILKAWADNVMMDRKTVKTLHSLQLKP